MPAGKENEQNKVTAWNLCKYNPILPRTVLEGFYLHSEFPFNGPKTVMRQFYFAVDTGNKHCFHLEGSHIVLGGLSEVIRRGKNQCQNYL